MAKKPKANWSSFTKAELVQACCTLEAQKAKLQKRIMALERAQDTLTGHLAGAVGVVERLENVAPLLKPDDEYARARRGGKVRVTHVEPGEDTESDLVHVVEQVTREQLAEAAKLPGVGPCKPFPWEPK